MSYFILYTLSFLGMSVARKDGQSVNNYHMTASSFVQINQAAYRDIFLCVQCATDHSTFVVMVKTAFINK